MNIQKQNILILDPDLFRMMMREAKDVIKLAELPKYNLMSAEALDLYNFWSPYVLNDIPSSKVNSPGYKIGFTQLMSVLLALKSEKRDFIVDIPEQKEVKQSNIINFLSYKKK